MAATDHDVTRLLLDLSAGDSRAADALLPEVYDELRALAHHQLAGERSEHTLQPTALVHEVYLKLVDQDRARWQDRAHFIAVGAQAMRRILVDHARGRQRLKRGGSAQRLGLHDGLALAGLDERTDLLTLDDALNDLTAAYPNHARVVELRFFGGLTAEEAAVVLDVTTRTVERHWQFARAWLFRAIEGGAA